MEWRGGWLWKESLVGRRVYESTSARPPSFQVGCKGVCSIYIKVSEIIKKIQSRREVDDMLYGYKSKQGSFEHNRHLDPYSKFNDSRPCDSK